jgi:hypothetical protein
MRLHGEVKSIKVLVMTEPNWVPLVKIDDRWLYPGYMVSDTGFVWMLTGVKTAGQRVKHSESSYRRIRLLDSERMPFKTSVHIAVCEAFHGPRPTKEHTVDHIDRIRHNNHSSNLRWASKIVQYDNRVTVERRSDFRLLQAAYDLQFNEIVDSEVSIPNRFGLSHQQLQMGVYQTRVNSSRMHGYYWRYKPNLNQIGEEWRPLSNYGEIQLRAGYMISSHGRFFLETGGCGASGQYRRGSLNPGHGYLQTSFKTHDGKVKQALVHIAVCETFHGPKPTPTHTVDHIDRDRTNNCSENLRWATKRAQNTNRAYNHAQV